MAGERAVTAPVPGPPGGGSRHSFALSTMYFQRWPDATDLAPFFACGRAMGFRRFELSHILPAGTVARIEPGVVEIVAVHHPCPADTRAGPPGDLTASDRDGRRAAAASLAHSLDTAARFGARAVVVHLGRVEDAPDGRGRRLAVELENRYRARLWATPRVAEVRAALVAWRREAEQRQLAGAIDALRDAAERAARLGVRIGVETGLGADTLPTPDGMAELLAAFDETVLGAWLDTGHVGVQRNLGLASFEAWLAAVGQRWIGVHAHDVVGLRDHLVPGAGRLDFAALARRLPPGVPVTCEVDWYFEPEEVAAGAAFLAERWPAALAPPARGSGPPEAPGTADPRAP